MDLFDGEPYLGLLPRWVSKAVAWTVVLSIAFVPAAREWVLNQATHHVMPEIEPMMRNLMPQFDPSTPSPAPTD